MRLRTRILPPDEWPRLVGTEAEKAWPLLDPKNARIVVVEEEGRIVATWIVMRVVHVECAWIDPSVRGSFGVMRRILGAMSEVAEAWGAANVISAAENEHVADLLVRLGGTKMPGDSFALPARMPRSKHVKLGRAFHEQLATLSSEKQHQEDPAHDNEVGKALVTAIKDGNPERAVADYNVWARAFGYEPIRYIGTFDGKVRVDIVTAVVEIDERYVVRVLQEATACP